jgi:hypothetical protein
MGPNLTPDAVVTSFGLPRFPKKAAPAAPSVDRTPVPQPEVVFARKQLLAPLMEARGRLLGTLLGGRGASLLGG